MLPLLPVLVGVSGAVVTKSFPYEQMVTAKLSKLSPSDAASYLSRHSTRYMLKQAGVTESEIAEARQILSEVVGSVVPSSSIAADPMFLDEDAALAAANFPIDESTLIHKAKCFLYHGQGVEKPELLADSFVFMGPFVGGDDGLPKDAYLKAVGGFNIKKAFPDLNPRFHHFRADPLDAGRVWFTSQASGTDSGEGFLGNAPTGKAFSTPPQACSIKFDQDGLAIKYTIGHVMERSLGNTGGLGGIFGPAYAIGKALPFREAQPWKPSLRYRAFMQIGRLLSWLSERKEAKA